MRISLDLFFVQALNEVGIQTDYKQLVELYRKSREYPACKARRAKNDKAAQAMAKEFFGEEPQKPEGDSKLRKSIDKFLAESDAYYDKLNEQEKQEAAGNGMTLNEWKEEKKRREEAAEKEEADARGITVEKLRRSKIAKERAREIAEKKEKKRLQAEKRLAKAAAKKVAESIE